MNYNSPYLPSYGPQTPMYQSYLPQTQVTKVSGENGARAFQMGANSSALLLDETGTIVWLVTTDGAGYKTVSPYDISPHKTQTQPDFTSLEARVMRLEEMINANATDSSAVKRKTSKPTATGDVSGD